MIHPKIAAMFFAFGMYFTKSKSETDSSKKCGNILLQVCHHNYSKTLPNPMKKYNVAFISVIFKITQFRLMHDLVILVHKYLLFQKQHLLTHLKIQFLVAIVLCFYYVGLPKMQFHFKFLFSLSENQQKRIALCWMNGIQIIFSIFGI